MAIGGILKFLNDIFLNFAEGLTRIFLQIVDNLMSFTVTILDNPLVTSTYRSIAGITSGVIVLLVVSQILRRNILGVFSNREIPLATLFQKVVGVILFIAFGLTIMRYIYRFGSLLADVVRFSSFDVSSFPLLNSKLFDQWVIFAGTVSLAHIFIGILLLLASIVLVLGIFLQTAVRTGHFALLIVVSPLVCASSISDDGQMFKQWFNMALVVSVSQAVQIFMLNAGFYIMSSAGSELNAIGVLLSSVFFLGFLFATLSAPSFLKQLMYSSGVARSATGMAKSLLYRKMMFGGK